MKKDASKDISKGSNAPIPQRPSFETDQIDELRKRLYTRGPETTRATTRHTIPPRTEVVQKEAQVQQSTPMQAPMTSAPVVTEDFASDTIEEMPRKNKRNTFRRIVALGGMIFFVIALVIASVVMFLGGTTVSGENISVTAEGSVAVGGGEEYEFQVVVSNQNTVPIQSAVLFVEYPKGARLANGENKEVSIERTPLNTINSGELVSVPLKALIYGEEGEEKKIKIWIEYRVAGSNATFEKPATPLSFTVTTSPVIVSFDAVERASSGREMEFDIIVKSNSETPLSNILVKVFYPDGFDYTESSPETVSGEDTWKFTTLSEGDKEVITIKGLLTGTENDTKRFGVTVGVPKDGVPNELASQLATAHTEIIIEQPSLSPQVQVNGSSGETVVVTNKTSTTIDIGYTNALDMTMYDGEIVATLSGNAVNDYQIDTLGDYDSRTNTVTWSHTDEYDLREIAPGRTEHFQITLEPKDTGRHTPELHVAVVMKGERGQGQSKQQLEGSTSRTIKVESAPELTSMTNYSEGPFINTGPIPPIADKVTQFTYLLTAEAGVNDLTGAEVTAILPAKVSWLDLVTGGDNVTFNSSTRTLKWTIGEMKASEEATAGVQISFLPSTSDIGKTPTILETQRFKATDRFTGTTVRADASSLTTSLTGRISDGRVEAD